MSRLVVVGLVVVAEPLRFSVEAGILLGTEPRELVTDALLSLVRGRAQPVDSLRVLGAFPISRRALAMKRCSEAKRVMVERASAVVQERARQCP